MSEIYIDEIIAHPGLKVTIRLVLRFVATNRLSFCPSQSIKKRSFSDTLQQTGKNTDGRA